MEDDPDLEYSIFCGDFTSDDTTVSVSITRAAGTSAGWRLEVTDRFNGVTMWHETFPSDRHAYEEFLAVVAEDGIDSFSRQSSYTIH